MQTLDLCPGGEQGLPRLSPSLSVKCISPKSSPHRSSPFEIGSSAHEIGQPRVFNITNRSVHFETFRTDPNEGKCSTSGQVRPAGRTKKKKADTHVGLLDRYPNIQVFAFLGTSTPPAHPCRGYAGSSRSIVLLLSIVQPIAHVNEEKPNAVPRRHAAYHSRLTAASLADINLRNNAYA